MSINTKVMGLAVFGAIILVFLPAPVRCGVSLGFIIDDTGSMSDDISGVSCFIY